MKQLYTERLILKRLQIKDVNNLFNVILNSEEDLHFLDWPFCEKIEQAKMFVNKLIGDIDNFKHYFWVIEERDTKNFIGCILICNYYEEKRMAEIEYIINSKYRGKGYATEAIKSVIDYLIIECNLYRIEAVCNIENEGSSRVLEKAGMKFEGILRGRALNLNELGNPGDLKMYSIIPSDLK